MADPTDWCYSSGVVAVLETFLLDPRAVRELAGQGAGEVLARVARNPVYAAMSPQHFDRPAEAAAAIEAALVTFARTFARDCPDPRVADVFLAPYDLRDLANHLKAKHCGIERRPVALSGLPEGEVEGAAAGVPWLARLAADVDVLAESGEGPLPPATIDLLADRAFLASVPLLTRPLTSPVIDAWAATRQRFAAVEAVLRARTQSVAMEELENILLAPGAFRFSQAAFRARLVALARAETDTLDRALADCLPEVPIHGWNLSDGPGAIQELAVRLDAVLDRVLAPARWVAHGPERVFVFLWRLFRENRNLRVVLGAAAGHLEPERVAQSLGGDHD